MCKRNWRQRAIYGAIAYCSLMLSLSASSQVVREPFNKFSGKQMMISDEMYVKKKLTFNDEKETRHIVSNKIVVDFDLNVVKIENPFQTTAYYRIIKYDLVLQEEGKVGGWLTLSDGIQMFIDWPSKIVLDGLKQTTTIIIREKCSSKSRQEGAPKLR